MFQRDYILRMIEMMGDFMRRVAELMDELSQMRLMDEECKRHCGLSLTALEALNSESLMEMLAPTPRLLASELLYMRATVFQMSLEEERELKRKSLRLLSSLYEEGPLCELRAARVEQLKEELLDVLTADELMACAEFLSQAGEYADMEDAIFQAVEAAGTVERMRHAARGVTLLRSGAKASARDLALARTSSHELRESAQELTVLAERLARQEKEQRNEGESDP